MHKLKRGGQMKTFKYISMLAVLFLSINAQSKVEQLGWLEGYWTAEKWGGTVDEYWSSPAGNSIIGMFRFVNDGEVQFTEHWMISEYDGKLSLRLRHFNPDFTGWEEKDEFVEFPLIEMGEYFIQFEGLIYELTGKNEMTVTLDMKQGDKIVQEIFSYKKK